MNPQELTDTLSKTAEELQFELIGAVPVGDSSTYPYYEKWISGKMHAGMDYLAKNPGARKNPEFLLPDARSLLMLGVSYRTVLESNPELRNLFFEPEDHAVSRKKDIKQEKGEKTFPEIYEIQQNHSGDSDRFEVASYACGIDYHDWIRKRLKKLKTLHLRLVPGSGVRGVVDTAPLLEREYAEKAGFGRVGKNTMLIHPKWGSRFFIGALLSTEIFQYNVRSHPETEENFCGDCRRCIESCPVGALSEEHGLDSRRCLNYWTIEHREGGGDFPQNLVAKGLIHGFGCEKCQNICPCNTVDTNCGTGTLSRKTLENMGEEAFKEKFSKTPLSRIYWGTLRKIVKF